MTTFAQWIKDQAGRQDAVGYFSRFWEANSPGRLSTPHGIQQHLEKMRAGAGDEREAASVGAALSGLRLAVPEYHRDNSAENAANSQAALEAHMSEQQPELPPDPPTTEDSPDYTPDSSLGLAGQPVFDHESGATNQPATRRRRGKAAETAESPGRYTGWPESRFDRLEDALARVEGKLDVLLGALFPEPIDWDALWSAADAYESAGGDSR